MKLPVWATTVTPFTKRLALFLYIFLPFAGFYLGMQYQGKLDENKQYISSPVLNISPTSTPGSSSVINWKTYTNDTYHFSLQYPNLWLAKENEATILFRPSNSETANDSWGLITLTVTPNTYSTLDGYINNAIICTEEAGAANTCPTGTPGTVRIVDGIAAREINNPPAPVESKVVVFEKNKKIYILRVILDKSFEDTYSLEDKKMIFDHILSSLRFSNKNTGTSPTCIPRPACLDATPRCMIPETENMCPKPTEAVMCTQEAKMCPNGSSVGRTGPNCEFAPCPSNTP